MSNLESYAHRAAKEVFAGWLREVAAEAGHDNYASLGALSWRVNREGPHWGVWVEYPFLGADADVWDETFLPGDRSVWTDSPWAERPPSFDECIRHYGKAPQWIVDVAVQHKGWISTVCEIVHKHPPSTDKIAALERITSTGRVWVIPARWVLGQVRRPLTIPLEFCVTGPARTRAAA